MRQEKDRCLAAIHTAMDGARVALICSGDPGVYALAGLVLELLSVHPMGNMLSVRVVPGITSLNACASLLGAPVGHDFAVISLSDILTPWSIIRKRLEAVSLADFVIVLYNPRSHRRIDQLKEAVSIIASHRSGETPVGVVKKAMRQGQEVMLTDLDNVLNCEIDMQTTVIIGNSSSFVWNDYMITPRGYKIDA